MYDAYSFAAEDEDEDVEDLEDLDVISLLNSNPADAAPHPSTASPARSVSWACSLEVESDAEAEAPADL